MAELARAGGNGASIVADGGQRFGKLLDRCVEIVAKLLHGWHEGPLERLRQVAFRQAAEGAGDFADGAHARGNVRGEFHDLVDFAVGVDDGVIGRLNPDFLAALAVADEFVGDELALRRALPEALVFLGAGIGRITENAVMLADEFAERITHGATEVLVGGQDFAGRQEFDDGLRARECLELARIVDCLLLGLRDIDGEFYNLHRFSVAEDGVVGGLYPDLAIALGMTLIGTGIIFAAAETRPEILIGRGCDIGGITEHPVMIADDFLQLIAQRTTEILVCGQYLTLEIELDDGLRFGNGGKSAAGVG